MIKIIDWEVGTVGKHMLPYTQKHRNWINPVNWPACCINLMHSVSFYSQNGMRHAN